MSFNFSPKIITDGLVLYLDAANNKSYISGSISWNDLTKNQNISTLVNGPSFNTGNGGSIVFDGVDDYGLISSNDIFSYGTGDFTWDVWVNASSLTSNHYVIDHGNVNGGTIAFQNVAAGAGPSGIRYYNTTIGINVNLFYPGFGDINFFLTDQWFNLVASRISGTTYLYRNSQLTVSGSDSHNYPTQQLTLGNAGSLVAPYNGKISNIKIYKGKGLTSEEVLQNYNSLKNRFGL